MGTKILAGPLQRLWNIWRWGTGQKGPAELELDLPIQAVADLQRQAELNAHPSRAFGGYWRFSGVHTHAGAGAIQTDVLFDTNNSGQGFEFNPDTDWIWFIQGFGQVVGGNFSRCVILEKSPSNRAYAVTDGTPEADVYRLLWRADVIDGGGYMFASGEPSQLPQPRLIFFPGETGLELYSVATAATVINVEGIIWIGRRGAYPPGLS